MSSITEYLCDDEAVSYLVDGLNLSRGALNPVLYDVERIEVLRGPQSTFCGRTSLGGAIKVETVRPQLLFQGQVGIEYGRFNDIGLMGMVNVPVTKKFMVRASVYQQFADSYVRNLNPDNIGNNLSFTSARLALRFVPLGIIAKKGHHAFAMLKKTALQASPCIRRACHRLPHTDKALPEPRHLLRG